ncbi:hypothetical protein H2248_005163 [Termitomyces sp. 'cryptogamus']|nr:hypothetical protein H2248_005163 [Termitomyces sp. 'cryptogamus']
MASTSPVVKRKTNDEPTSAPRKKQHIVREQEEELALLQSLDFSALNSTSAISERFDHLGRSLIHDFHLVVKSSNEETVFEILELEFYLRKDGCHEDPFTHGSEEQKVCGKWYFHRAPRPSTDSTRSLTSLTAYRGGSRKGLDITIGDPPPTTLSPYFNQAMAPNQGSTRGGALLRSLRRVPDNKVVSGPSLLVDEILRLSKAADILELVEQKWAGDTSVFGSRPTSLFLRAKAPSSQPKPAVYRSPRIGLDLSHPGTTASSSHPRVVFLTRPYRYISCPECLTSKGRPQTFLGVLQSCLDTTCAGHDLASKHVLNELMRITGLGEKTASRYLEYYKNGLKSGKLKNFVGPQGKGASSSPAIYLQMMGTLAQYQVKTQQQTL